MLQTKNVQFNYSKTLQIQKTNLKICNVIVTNALAVCSKFRDNFIFHVPVIKSSPVITRRVALHNQTFNLSPLCI